MLGKPDEYFHPKTSSYYERVLGRKGLGGYSAVFDAVMRIGSTRNRIFAAKLLWPHIEYIAGRFHQSGLFADLDGIAILREQLEHLHVVRLVREDRLRQAISLYRAEQTGIWWKAQPRSLNSPIMVPFDFSRIKAHEKQLDAWEHAWDSMLRKSSIPWITVTYREMSDQPQEAIQRVIDFAAPCQTRAPLNLQTGLEIQADAVTEEWHDRCMAMTRAQVGDSVSSAGKNQTPAIC